MTEIRDITAVVGNLRRKTGRFVFLLPLLQGGGSEWMVRKPGVRPGASWVAGSEGGLFQRRTSGIGIDAAEVSGRYGMLPWKQTYVDRVHVANVNSNKR